MKIKIETNYMWEHLSDRERLSLIIELILSAPDAQKFLEKIKNKIEKLEVD